MTDEPNRNNEPSSEGDEAEFERVLRNLVNTPHKPHVPGPKPPVRKPAEG